MSRIVVIGGGFVGQLIQLAAPQARLLDNRQTPPLDWLETRQGPQYLWEPIPGVESVSFEVVTLVDGMEPTHESIRRYKAKIGKSRDGGDWARQFQYRTVGYHSELPKPRVEYGVTIVMVDLPGKTLGLSNGTTIGFDILINTIALPKFLQMMIVGPQHTEPFLNDPIHLRTFKGFHPKLPNAIVMDYQSNVHDPVYRFCHRGGDVWEESLFMSTGSRAIWPGKIHPNSESERILAELSVHQCYCFGRFATWRPDELAHESWKDIKSWAENSL